MKSNYIENELLKYIELNIAKIIYMMIKKFKDELINLKSIQNEIERLEMIRELEMDQVYEIKKEIEELETKTWCL